MRPWRRQLGWTVGPAVLLAACAACAACTAEAPGPGAPSAPPDVAAPMDLPDRPLRFADTPFPSTERQRDRAAFLEYLSAAIGHPVELLPSATTYDDTVDALSRGRADIGVLSPLSYVRATERLPNLRLLASILRDGQPRYCAYVVVGDRSELRDLQQLAGKRFGFGERASTSGYLFPSLMLRRAGIDPRHDFAEVRYIHAHTEIVAAIARGELDAGAVSSTTFSHTLGPQAGNGVRIIAKSDWIPYDAVVAHPDLSAPAAAALTAALLELSSRTAAGRRVLDGLVMMSGFVPAADESYDGVRAAVKELGAEAP